MPRATAETGWRQTIAEVDITRGCVVVEHVHTGKATGIVIVQHHDRRFVEQPVVTHPASFLRQTAEHTGDRNAVLPPRTLILDSSPGNHEVR
jgi:hypothetical protein